MVRRHSIVGVASVALVLTLAAVLLAVGMPDAPPWGTVLALSVGAGAVLWALRQSWHDRRRFEEALQRQAADQAVAAERLAIARDLHDLVSHGLGLITLRASVATRLADRDPATAPDALRDIERVSRATTTEMRRMLHVLRGTGDAPREPTPGLEAIPELLSRARAAGLDVRWTGEDVRSNSDGVALTAYRVVQEGLSNVARHAGQTQADVSLRHTGTTLEVRVSDAGRSAHWTPRPGANHGLLGLRERAGALGGTVEAGPRGDGWLLTAFLPDPSEVGDD
ncbi:MAG: histidine kinase [Propioniciclava sp.]|uniref:sensor histidine kinase n=1 Tax=Propioniciclava sp. TaxID=2038686 RepID=UPI0039E5A656